MLIIKILLGFLGLGIVVFVHELGHFLAARAVGIDVEAFSLGWGNPILKKKIGHVEYRIGMFPVGGYCKMRGESEFQEAYENRKNAVPPVPGTYMGASPWRRIITCVAGPLFNLIFAVLAFSVIWGMGFKVSTLENKIVLSSTITPGERYPADEADLQTGDRIIEIGGKPINYYHDIREQIAVNPEKTLSLKVERDGAVRDLTIKPHMDKSTGEGKIGVYFWNDPVVDAVTPGSPADIGGLKPGDRLLRVNGEPVPYTVALLPIIERQPPVLSVEYERNGRAGQTDLIMAYPAGDIGISYRTVEYQTPRLSPAGAIAKGSAEAWKTLAISVRSFALLFKGIDLTQAVSGPVRITYMVGDVATEGFGQSFADGLRSMANFLSLISIALCIMNLLPIPIVDGGMILLWLVEGITRKPLHPRIITGFQAVGAVLIFGLMAFALFGDILYFVRR
ncbi:MAG: site-2 protease family protein [Spirochaetaceae bacterium]|jgi:regulator of sigma E protease|nr:site-2 protease family protein [Spirochaetaceae bacterium]